MTMTNREANQLTNEKCLYKSQLQAILPVLTYLVDRLNENNVPTTVSDMTILTSVNKFMKARTFEEVETIVGDATTALRRDAIEELTAELTNLKNSSEEVEQPEQYDLGSDEFKDPFNGRDTWNDEENGDCGDEHDR